jgi:hypothetical protein
MAILSGVAMVALRHIVAQGAQKVNKNMKT